MLSEEEYVAIGIINRSTQIAFSSIVGLAISPQIQNAILDLEKNGIGFLSFGSKLLDKYNKKVVLNLPPIFWDAEYKEEKRRHYLKRTH